MTQNTEHLTIHPDADFEALLESCTRRVLVDQLPVLDRDVLYDPQWLDNKGQPSKWWVDERHDDGTLTISLMSNLPCSIDWCIGHSLPSDLRDAPDWVSLSHVGELESLVARPSLPAPRFAQGANLVLDENGYSLSLWLHVDADTDANGCEALAADLLAAAGKLRMRAAGLRELASLS